MAWSERKVAGLLSAEEGHVLGDWRLQSPTQAPGAHHAVYHLPLRLLHLPAMMQTEDCGCSGLKRP